MECAKCECIINVADPHVISDNYFYCWDCGYINGYISENEYLKLCGVLIDSLHASIQDNKVIIWCGNTPPWEVNENKRERKSMKYKLWRAKVLERDNFTCQKCSEKDGILNAHHKKLFSKFKELRYEVSNGITLCLKCHKQVHKSR